jgi:hypothetical protein
MDEFHPLEDNIMFASVVVKTWFITMEVKGWILHIYNLFSFWGLC